MYNVHGKTEFKSNSYTVVLVSGTAGLGSEVMFAGGVLKGGAKGSGPLKVVCCSLFFLPSLCLCFFFVFNLVCFFVLDKCLFFVFFDLCLLSSAELISLELLSSEEDKLESLDELECLCFLLCLDFLSALWLDLDLDLAFLFARGISMDESVSDRLELLVLFFFFAKLFLS